MTLIQHNCKTGHVTFSMRQKIYGKTHSHEHTESTEQSKIKI